MADSDDDDRNEQERKELIKEIEKRYPHLAYNLRTGDIRLMCDKLLEKGMFHRELIDQIFCEKTEADKARRFIDIILKADLQHIIYFLDLLKDIMPTIHNSILKAKNLYKFANREIRKTIKKLENSKNAKSEPEISQLKNKLEEQLTSLSSLNTLIQKTLENFQRDTLTSTQPPQSTLTPIDGSDSSFYEINNCPNNGNPPNEKQKNNQKCQKCSINDIKIDNLECTVKKISNERDNYYKIIKVLINELESTCKNTGLCENVEKIVNDRCKDVINEADLKDLFRKISIEKLFLARNGDSDSESSDSSESLDMKNESATSKNTNNNDQQLIQSSIINSEKTMEMDTHSEPLWSSDYIEYHLDEHLQPAETQQKHPELNPYEDLQDAEGGGADSNSIDPVHYRRRPAMKKPKPNSTGSIFTPPPLPTSKPPSRSLSTQSSINTVIDEYPLHDDDSECQNSKNDGQNNSENK